MNAKLVPYFALIALSTVPAMHAATPPELELSDGLGNSATIDSTGTVTCAGICSTNFTLVSPGSVKWSGIVGGFTINIVTGSTKPLLSPPQMSLSFLVQTGMTGGTINVAFTDVGFDGLGPVTLTASDTLAGSVNATYTGYVDDTNTPFGMGTTVATFSHSVPGGNSTTMTGPGPTVQPYSMTTAVSAVMGPNSGFSLAGENLMGTPPPPLALNCAGGTGQVGVAYNSSLTATGGVPPYTYSIFSGSLPGGLTLNPATGAITGTPSASGTFTFTAQVVDSNTNTAANTVQTGCTIVISPPPQLTLSCVSATTGQVGVPYASQLVASGGVPQYTFSITSGSLPPGLTLDTMSGNITGVPTMAGTFMFTAQVKDSTNTAAGTTTVNCSITIAPPPTATCISITAVQGVPITPVTMIGSGGAGGPYTFTATGLPNGLSISPGGTISGTPTVSGTFNYRVTVKDSAGNTGTVNCSVTVAPPPSATCVSITAIQGVAITPVTMVGSGGAGGPYTFTATGLPNGLSISSGGTISGTPTVSGTFNYTVTVKDSAGNTGTVNCSVAVQPPGGNACKIGPSSMEGSLTNIRPGDWISGGYDFTIPGSHPQTTVTVSNVTVTLPVYCPQGGGPGGNIVITLPNASYAVGANNTNWIPTGDQNSVLSWEGSVQAPDLCGGHPMANQSGALYSSTTNTNGGANFRFKYRDPNAKGKGNVNCADPNWIPISQRNDAATCGASWSQTVTCQ